MVGNGEGSTAETNIGKKAYAQLVVKPLKGFFLDFYIDAECQKDSRNLRLYHFFSGYEGPWGRAGFLYAERKMRMIEARERWRLWSVFASVKTLPKVELVVRFDRVPDLNPAGPGISYIPFSDHAPSNLVIAGVGWKITENIVIIPNIKHVFYDKLEGASGYRSAPYLNLSAGLVF